VIDNEFISEPDMELLPNALSKKRGHGLSQMPINARD
jgi:hypothetical protein